MIDFGALLFSLCITEVMYKYCCTYSNTSQSSGRDEGVISQEHHENEARPCENGFHIKITISLHLVSHNDVKKNVLPKRNTKQIYNYGYSKIAVIYVK